MDQLLVQCAEIVKNGKIIISNEQEQEVLRHPVINTNFIHIDINLPNGSYHLELLEEGKTTKRNFKL